MNHVTRVWDLPTRLFHWLLVALVIGLFISGYRGGAAMDWHARMGFATLAALAFRIVWGLVGGRWSRFTSFLRSPGAVSAFLRGEAHPDHLVGHNPLGGLSVLAMLLVLFAQVGTGLIGDDETAFTGPLNRLVQTSTGLAATWYHKRVGQWLLVGLVVLHVVAIAYYRLRKRDDLVGAMLSGDKLLAQPARPSRDDWMSRVAALVVFAACALGVSWLVSRS